jgi:prepilin peptidase CpaA
VIVSIVQHLLFVLFPAAMTCAAFSDLGTMTISNKLSLALIAGFALLAPVVGMDWPTLGMHLAAGGVVLAVSFTFFALGWIGGGDAKFAAATALWLGWAHLVEFLGLAAVFGGILTLVILSFRRSVLPAFVITQPWVQRLHDEKAGVPYGVALAAAGLVMYPDTIWIRMVVG